MIAFYYLGLQKKIVLNIVIDAGNTQIKVAVFKDAKFLFKVAGPHKNFAKLLDKIAGKYPGIKHAIVSAVGHFYPEHLILLQSKYKVLQLSHNLLFPFVNRYKTPQTLGLDRIALVTSAVLNFPNKNCLIIDAGSCITYDIVNCKSQYLGGAISPGIYMRYQALQTFTKSLPRLTLKKEKHTIGNSTQSSIHIGIAKGVLYEIEGFITEYKRQFKDLTIILTGGDAHFLLDNLNFNIFANSNFLLEGLNHILEHNLS